MYRVAYKIYLTEAVKLTDGTRRIYLDTRQQDSENRMTSVVEAYLASHVTIQFISDIRYQITRSHKNQHDMTSSPTHRTSYSSCISNPNSLLQHMCDFSAVRIVW